MLACYRPVAKAGPLSLTNRDPDTSDRQVRQWVAGRQLPSPSFSARAQTLSHLQGPSFGIIGVMCTILQKVCPFCSTPLRGRVRRHPRCSGSADPAVRCVRGRGLRTSPYTLLVIPNKSCSAMQASFFADRASAGVDTFSHVTHLLGPCAAATQPGSPRFGEPP